MMKDLPIAFSIPAEMKTKDQALGYAIKNLRKIISDQIDLEGFLQPFGDIQLVALQSAIKFVGTTSHGTFAAAIRRYELAMEERVLCIETKELNPGDDTPRKLYFAEQIRRVKEYKDASEGRGPFPKKQK